MARRGTKQTFGQSPLLRRLVDGALSEKGWQNQVEQALRLFKWPIVFHAPTNVVVCEACGHRNFRYVIKGFPDLLALKPPFRPRWIELKRERGWVDPDQKSFHSLLRACGERVLVARPRDREYLFNEIAHPSDD